MFLFALMSFRHDILGLLIVANYLIYCCLYASTTKLKNFSLKKPNSKKLFSRNGMFFFNLALKAKIAITNFIPVFSLQVFFWRFKLHSLVLKSVFFLRVFPILNYIASLFKPGYELRNIHRLWYCLCKKSKSTYNMFKFISTPATCSLTTSIFVFLNGV